MIVALLREIEAAGGVVSLRDGKPVVAAPLGAVPAELINRLRAARADVVAHLRERESTSTLAAWSAGLARLQAMEPPPSFVGKDWSTLVADAVTFMGRWGPPAAAGGWPSWAVWGVQRRVPSSWRGRELVALLGGCPVVALTATEAVIDVCPGVRHVYRSLERDPLHPAERCLLWELGDGGCPPPGEADGHRESASALQGGSDAAFHRAAAPQPRPDAMPFDDGWALEEIGQR